MNLSKFMKKWRYYLLAVVILITVTLTLLLVGDCIFRYARKRPVWTQHNYAAVEINNNGVGTPQQSNSQEIMKDENQDAIEAGINKLHEQQYPFMPYSSVRSKIDEAELPTLKSLNLNSFLRNEEELKLQRELRERNEKEMSPPDIYCVFSGFNISDANLAEFIKQNKKIAYFNASSNVFNAKSPFEYFEVTGSGCMLKTFNPRDVNAANASIATQHDKVGLKMHDFSCTPYLISNLLATIPSNKHELVKNKLFSGDIPSIYTDLEIKFIIQTLIEESADLNHVMNEFTCEVETHYKSVKDIKIIYMVNKRNVQSVKVANKIRNAKKIKDDFSVANKLHLSIADKIIASGKTHKILTSVRNNILEDLGQIHSMKEQFDYNWNILNEIGNEIQKKVNVYKKFNVDTKNWKNCDGRDAECSKICRQIMNLVGNYNRVFCKFAFSYGCVGSFNKLSAHLDETNMKIDEVENLILGIGLF